MYLLKKPDRKVFEQQALIKYFKKFKFFKEREMNGRDIAEIIECLEI